MPGLIRLVVLAICIGLSTRCAPAVIKSSARNPDLFEKEGSTLQKSTNSEHNSSPPEIYVRQPNLIVKPVEGENDSGSLINLEDERNFLYSSAGPHKIGRFVSVKIASNLKPKEKKPEDAKKDDKAAKDDVEKEILEAIPDLAPADESTRLLDQMKMEIKHRFDNGDVLAMFKRRSSSANDLEDMTVSARIPYDRLMAGDTLTTDDLIDVKMVASKDGELIESRSSGWEDEYSLRLSGFDEAKSKTAMELEDKRRKLEEARKNLQNRVKSFGKERDLVAKQRDELSKEKAKMDEEKAQLLKQIGEKSTANGGANAAMNATDSPVAKQADNNQPNNQENSAQTPQ